MLHCFGSHHKCNADYCKVVKNLQSASNEADTVVSLPISIPCSSLVITSINLQSTSTQTELQISDNIPGTGIDGQSTYDSLSTSECLSSSDCLSTCDCLFTFHCLSTSTCLSSSDDIANSSGLPTDTET